MPNKSFHIKPAIESEKTVLGGLLLDNTLFVGLNQQLCPADFDLHFHKEIFESMCKLISKHKKFDVAMIVDDLQVSKDQQPYIYELANNCPSTANIKAHADIIREKSVQRQLIAVATDIAEHANHPGKADVKAILDKAENSVMKLAVAYDVNICPAQMRLCAFLDEFTAEIKATDLTEEYLHECIVEINKAFISTLAHIEELHVET